MSKAKSELPVLTREELEAARRACANCAVAAKAAAAAEKEKAGAIAQVFFKMGFWNMDEVKALDPVTLAKTIEKRLGKQFEVEKDALGAYAVVKTSSGRYPQWKQELQALNGPAEVARIEAETAEKFSYGLIEAEAAKPGSTGVIVLESAKARAKT